MRGLGYLRYESRDDLGGGAGCAAQLFASAQRDRLDDAAAETGLGGAALTREHHPDRGPERPRGAADRRMGARRDRARGAVRELPSRERGRDGPVGVPARRLTGVAGAEIDLRWRWANLDVIPSARLEAMQDAISRRDAMGTPIEGTPAVSRQAPVLRLGFVRPLVDRPALKITAKANVGRYARVPSFIELYGNGTAMVLGNADLVPEHGTNGDVGVWIDRAGERLGVLSRTTAFAVRGSTI